MAAALKAVVSSFEEAARSCSPFCSFPNRSGKRCAPLTLERINREFRRRTKTQAALPDEDAVLLLLYGLLRSGQIVLRGIHGRDDMPKPKSQLNAARDVNYLTR